MEKIERRVFLVRSLAFLGLGASLSADVAFGAIDWLDSDYLKNELRVKTDKEEAFVDDVVVKTKKGELPMKILRASYAYAMKKNKPKRVVYFAKCLEILTKQAGLKISFLKF